MLQFMWNVTLLGTQFYISAPFKHKPKNTKSECKTWENSSNMYSKQSREYQRLRLKVYNKVCWHNNNFHFISTVANL